MRDPVIAQEANCTTLLARPQQPPPANCWSFFKLAKRGPAPYQVAVAAKSTVRRYTQTARLRQRLIDQRRETAAIALALRALTRELRSASDWPRTPTAVPASSPQFFFFSCPCARTRSARDWPDALFPAQVSAVSREAALRSRGVPSCLLYTSPSPRD